MPRSLRVAPEHIERVKQAVWRNDFPRQKDLAEDLGLSSSTVNSFLNGKSVDFNNFLELCKRLGLTWQAIAVLDEPSKASSHDEIEESISSSLPVQRQPSSAHSRQDWGDAVDVSVFYGRTEERATLKQWVLEDGCRLVALLGMGGMGKTALSVKLAQEIQDSFEYVIWRSLRNAPPIEEILSDWIKFLSNQQETNPAGSCDRQISLLLNYLRESRCLLILDNVESILQGDSLGDGSTSRVGYYRESYEDFGDLFRRVGETQRQSCLIITSREKPKEFTRLAGKTKPVRYLQLAGLETVAGQAIFKAEGFSGTEMGCSELIARYAGNPLALKIKTLASGSEDGTIKLWDVERGEYLETMRTPRPYAGMNITGVTGLTEAQKATLRALGAVEED